jgi:hypothetical protein
LGCSFEGAGGFCGLSGRAKAAHPTAHTTIITGFSISFLNAVMSSAPSAFSGRADRQDRRPRRVDHNAQYFMANDRTALTKHDQKNNSEHSFAAK